MSRQIVFRLPAGEIQGEFIDSSETEGLIKQLPLTSSGNVWGKEIYFEIPKAIKPGLKTKDVEVGEVAYWDEGQSVCIFFGPTPVSRGTKPEPYVPVFKIGRVRVDGNAMELLSGFKQGQPITISAATG